MKGKFIRHYCPRTGEAEDYKSIILDAANGEYLVQVLYVVSSPYRRRGAGAVMTIPMKAVTFVYSQEPECTVYDWKAGGQYNIPISLYGAFKRADSKEAFKQYLAPPGG